MLHAAARVNAVSALHWIAEHVEHGALEQLVTARTQSGETALRLACLEGHAEAVRLLQFLSMTLRTCLPLALWAWVARLTTSLPSAHWVGDPQVASGTDLLADLLNNIASFEPVALSVLCFSHSW